MMSLGCFVLLFVGAASAKKIVVTFPDRGPAYPIGTITLTQNKGGPLKIETNLQRLENSDNGNAWHVHIFPTSDEGGITGVPENGGARVDECGALVTGGHFNPLFTPYGEPPGNPDQTLYEIGDFAGKHGKLAATAATTTDQSIFTDNTASIIYDKTPGSKGNTYIVGRSIVIHAANGDRWACANIGDAGYGATATFPAAGVLNPETGEATPEGLPSGKIEFFQPSTADSTAMIVDLDGLEQAGNKWHVHEYPVPSSGDCAGTGGHFDPKGADYEGSEAPPPYEYGDLSGKWGKLNAPSADPAANGNFFVGTGKGFVTDATLPLSGPMSVLGRSIVIHKADGSRWACATIPMRIRVNFPDLGLGYPRGSIFLSQASVSAALTITTSLKQLEGATTDPTGLGNKWHVHSFPTDEDGGFDLGCSNAVTGGHFNPTFKTAPFDPADKSSYEVGDFSGKHGNLASGIGETEDAQTYPDNYASILYDPEQGSRGRMWIVGRSIVIHKAVAPFDRWVCANIGSAGIGATATFPQGSGLPYGTIEFFQPSLFWDTAMIVDLRGLEGGNKWHVHEYPVPGSGDCLGTGGHFDPTGANYGGEGSDAPPPYEVGDLSGKHGKLNQGTQQLFLSDGSGFAATKKGEALPLSGDMSVLGRSIVIHKADGSRWACASLSPRSQRAEFNVFDGPAGYIEIFSPDASSTSTISVNLANLGSGEKGWHVHELPAPIGGYATGSACMGTAAHFNPSFGAGVAEDGDLSARHEKLSGRETRAYFADELVKLHGNKSVMGRSIVIHKPNGERWACANIGPAGYGYTVTFPSAGEGSEYPEGTVQFFQAYEGATTTVTVRLANMPAEGGGLRLHKLAVPGQAQTATGGDACGSVGDVHRDLDEIMGSKLVGLGEKKEAKRFFAAPSLELGREGTQARPDEDNIFGSTLVVTENGAPRACATIGLRSNTSLEQLEWVISELGAETLLLSAAWMRRAGQPTCGVATALFVAICTVFLLPGLLQALAVGYMWTYAFGGTEGWPLGAFCFWIGACAGAMISYALGNALLGRWLSQEMRARTFLARAENAMEKTPLRLLIVLRLCPLVPFNLLNYYVGATYRFKLWHNLVSLLFIFPACIIWAGIGAAWHKLWLIEEGYAQSSRYIASIWTGIGVTIAFTLVASGVACCVLRRAELKARGTPEADANAPLSEGGVAIDVDGGKKKKKGFGLFGKKGKKDAEGDLVVRPPAGPPPGGAPPSVPPPSVPPPAGSVRISAADAQALEETGELEEGWQRIEDEDGDVYFYHEASGESRWEPPLKNGGSYRGSVSRSSAITITAVEAPPMPPPPAYESKESSVEMMAE